MSMTCATLRTLMVAAALSCGVYGTSLHLAIDAHHWDHPHHADETGHEHDSEGESHPGADHELSAIANGSRVISPVIDVLILGVAVRAPDVRVCLPSIEPEAQSPPAVFASPPRSPRSPPV
jgi:hypothetical protein